MKSIIVFALSVFLLASIVSVETPHSREALCTRIAQVVAAHTSITGKSIILRPLSSADAEDVFRCGSDKETVALTPALVANGKSEHVLIRYRL